MTEIDAAYLAPPKAALRLSDAERTQAVQELDRQAAEGRLSVSELDEREEAARRAVTRGDLAPLFADLPIASAMEPPEWSEQREPLTAEPRSNVAVVLVALSPFAAVLLFFLTGTTVGWAYAWLWFLLIPVTAIIAFVGRPNQR